MNAKKRTQQRADNRFSIAFHGEIPFTQIPNWLVRFGQWPAPYKITPLQFALLCSLYKFGRNQGVACPSYRTVAAEIGITYRAVITNFQHLEKLGLILVERDEASSGHRPNSNMYTLLVYAPPAIKEALDAIDKSKREKTEKNGEEIEAGYVNGGVHTQPDTYTENHIYVNVDSPIGERPFTRIIRSNNNIEQYTTTTTAEVEVADDVLLEQPTTTPVSPANQSTPPVKLERQITNEPPPTHAAGRGPRTLADLPLAERRYRLMREADGKPMKLATPLPLSVREYIGQLAPRNFTDDEINAAFDAAEGAGAFNWNYVKAVLERNHGAFRPARTSENRDGAQASNQQREIPASAPYAAYVPRPRVERTISFSEAQRIVDAEIQAAKAAKVAQPQLNH